VTNDDFLTMPFPPRLVIKEWDTEVPVPLVWDVLAQTDKLNRAIGLPPVENGALHGQEISRTVHARLFGFIPLHWIESPFEWVREHRYVVQRDFPSGPLRRFRGGVEVEPRGAGSRIRVFAELTPRNWLGRLAIPLVGWTALGRTWAYCSRIFCQALEQRTAASSAKFLPAASVVRTRADAALLAQRAAALRAEASLDPATLDALLRHLSGAGDDEVVRMRPYALADGWGLPRREALRVFLHATRSGLLDLAWELLCPNCRVPKTEAGALARVTRRFHCDTCGIGYEANFDRYVELRFRVHPAVRGAHDAVYCFGGPYNAPHVLVQHVLQPGESRDLLMTLNDEAYRIRTLRTNRAVTLSPVPGSAPMDRLAVAYLGGAWDRAESRFHPGPVELRWTNGSSSAIGLVLERMHWDDQAVTAAEVTALQEFRDLFGSEVLAPGQEIGVESVTIVFSDLKDSTRLYEEAGDAPAYGQVGRHFEFLKERVARHHGAVVKTIGDAVMAVFHQPADALRCCLAIQRDLPALNAAWPARPLVVKLGLHSGPAIAINANGLLDYFGRTVNIASRLLRESRGDDLVLAKGFTGDVRVGEALTQERPVVADEWTATLRGMSEPLTLCRLKVKQ
jgi:class 3 adenylate cyclase